MAIIDNNVSWKFEWNFVSITAIVLAIFMVMSMVVLTFWICWLYYRDHDNEGDDARDGDNEGPDAYHGDNDDDNHRHHHQHELISIVVIDNVNQNVIKEERKEDKCVICLESLFKIDDDSTIGQVVVESKQCNHVFHQTCITNWTRVHKTCPICRLPLHYLHTVSSEVTAKPIDRDAVENIV
ncbi:hypothetical protein CsatA_011806 [Cannabis sativa]